MTEAQFTRALVHDLRQVLDRTVIFKHNDRLTAGVPDLSVTYHGRTTWLEVKHLPRLRAVEGFISINPRHVVPLIQWETLRRLETGYALIATGGGAIVFHAAGECPAEFRSQGLGRLELLLLLIKIFQQQEASQ